LAAILDTITKPDGTSYNLYKDGLQVVTTLDYEMQLAAELAMKTHLSKLQGHFERAYGSAAPWQKRTPVFNAALKRLPLYKTLKAQGLSAQQIDDTLAVKRNMELFSWQGDIEKAVSVKDSLQHFLKFLNTGMLSIDPATGAIRTYIGGIDYRYFKYDHVALSARQVGSTFKPFVYTAAIENGMKPCKYFSLKPVSYVNYNHWTPKNSGTEDDVFINYSLEKALSHSVNTIAVKVLEATGILKVKDQVKLLGITQDLPHLPSIALGVTAINLKTLTGAYASYVNAGKPVQPFCIKEIKDRTGTVIATIKPKISKTPAFSPYTQQALLEMMRSTVNSGTASRLRSTYKLTNAIAGKTGTTQDNKDGWFVALTPKLVTVTWVGNDANIGFNSTRLGQGANSALPIFALFYQKLTRDSKYNAITKSKFEITSQEAIEDLKCQPEKRDGFFKRLLGGKQKKKRFRVHQ
jgi:penicillin-binding protein 1A